MVALSSSSHRAPAPAAARHKPQVPGAVAHMRSGRGNWHLLSESELTELCLALGVPPEQTGTMTKVGLIAALRTRLVMSKHRGDHSASISRFERLPAPSFADSRVEARGSPPRRGLGDASQSHSRATERRSSRADVSSSRDTRSRSRPAGERRGKASTWKRSMHKNFDMTADDLNDMEETFRRQMQEGRAENAHAGWVAEANADSLHKTVAGTGEAENKLRWYENSVLEYGLQINSMVQQDIVGDAAAAAASSASFSLAAAPSGSTIAQHPAAGAPSGRMAAAPRSDQSELAAMSASFAKLERRMADASMTIDDSCRAAAVGSTVDEMLEAVQGSQQEAAGFAAAAAAVGGGGAARGVTVDDIRAAAAAAAASGGGGGVRSPESTGSQATSHASAESGASGGRAGGGGGALGLAPWLESGGQERFGAFDRDGNGVLDRGELESAVGTFLARGEGMGGDERDWAKALQASMPTGALDNPAAQEALRGGGEEWAQRLRRDMPGLSVEAQLRE